MLGTENTKLKYLYYLLMGVFLLLMVSTQACGKRDMIKGQIVDLKTKKPIEGAVVAIKWMEQSFGLPGLGAPSKVIEEYETVSDKEGYFHFPDYAYSFSKSYYMGAYKQGYVCWSSRSVFFPDKATRKKKVERRESDVSIEDGMTVCLEPLPEGYSRVEHGGYAKDVCGQGGDCSGLFLEAILPEYKEHMKWIKRKK